MTFRSDGGGCVSVNNGKQRQTEGTMKSCKIDDMKNASDAFKKANPDLFGLPSDVLKNRTTEKPVISQKSRLDRLNKTEMRFYDDFYLEHKGKIIIQPPKFFELAGGGTYTPDFLFVRDDGKGVGVYEIKGGYRGPGWEQGIERFKRAAAQYDGEKFHFMLWTWNREDGEWDVEHWKSSRNLNTSLPDSQICATLVKSGVGIQTAKTSLKTKGNEDGQT